MNNMLEKIVAQKQIEINAMPILEAKKSHRDFYQAIVSAENNFGVIAEIKPKSPSAGMIAQDHDPVSIAKAYEQAGVNAISVLTDHEFFGGSFESLKKVREVVSLPLLCKEFIISEKQIAYARAHGADACLLIANILSEKKLVELKKNIESYNMLALIEIFELSELDKVLKTQPKMIGINNRNLNNFNMNTQNSNNLANHISNDICVISASGVKAPEDVASLDKNIDGVLVGTALMKSDDKTNFIKSIRNYR